MTETIPTPRASSILVINAGSSSIKFALFREADPPVPVTRGLIDRIGLPDSVMVVSDVPTNRSKRHAVEVQDHRASVECLMEWIAQDVGMQNLRAVGHRIVHGGAMFSRSDRVTRDMLAELRRLSPYDPEHLPSEINLIDALAQRHPSLLQIACFDTAFHRGMPQVARLLPIPRRYGKAGLQRYGFHGLSYAFLMKELARVGNPGEASGRLILAHLGNGASMAAVKEGQPVDTTMGFTPASGLPMSRRSGDLDPGLISYLAQTEGMTVERFHKMVNAESGLLGISELSSDMRDLLAQEHGDPRAAEAVELFCYHVKKAIGALAASLGGLDTLVFTAGIGEHAPVIRARICIGLEFLGVAFDEDRNEAGAPVISTTDSRVTVRVMHTDEECEIAQSVVHVLNSIPNG
ncbi:acetate/propionate family kinase [Nitrospira sp. CMX1]|nr:acetate/propionate family kinase [Nitrospira sp.]